MKKIKRFANAFVGPAMALIAIGGAFLAIVGTNQIYKYEFEKEEND